MKVSINLKKGKYDVFIKEGILSEISSYFQDGRKYLIITDDGVPQQYVQTVLSQLEKSEQYVVVKGEKSKSLLTYQKILRYLLINNYTNVIL